MFTGGRIRDPMPSDTPAPFPHTVRGRPDHRSASAVPVLTVGAEGRVVECVEVHSKTPTPSFFFVPLSHVFGNQTQFLVFVPLSSCTEPQETGWLGLRRGF